MTRWVALLRGVNVNGITVRSAELAELFRDLGFASVRTVLASGNVCFDAGEDADPAELKARIEAGLSERFGYEAFIVLSPHEHLARVIEAYPFSQDADHHAYVIFASTAEARDELLSLALTARPGATEQGASEAGATEQFAGGDGVIYWRCPKGATLDTPFSKQVAKARFKATTTNRNINTLRKML